MKSELFIIIIIFFLLVGFSGIICFFNIPSTSSHYIGQIVFNEEADYQEFKEFLVTNSISIKDNYDKPTIIVLSSKPPIIVNYDLDNIPNNIPFPYTFEQHKYGTASLNGIVGGIMMSLGFGGVAFSFLVKYTWPGMAK